MEEAKERKGIDPRRRVSAPRVVQAYDTVFARNVTFALEPGEVIARCEACRHPFVILELDLAACRELKGLRHKNPASVSLHAGVVLSTGFGSTEE